MSCTTHHHACECREEKFRRMQVVADAAQRLLNEVHCYSTGIALMAEEDMVQLFGEFTEAQEQLAALDATECEHDWLTQTMTSYPAKEHSRSCCKCGLTEKRGTL